MKSCVEWRKSFEFKDEIDEFNIYFKDKEKELIYFVEKYSTSHRINIRIPVDISDNQLNLLVAIADKYKNIAIVFNWYTLEDNEEAYNKIKKANIPFYFTYCIDNWDELLGFCDLGVSDVYITGELGFDLKRVANIVHMKGIQIRAYVDAAQEGWGIGRDGFKAFYVRPEDIDIYEKYIDIIEFYNSWGDTNRINTLFKIYFHDKEWNGNLQEIISGLKVRVNGYYILGTEFGRRRTECQRRCMKGERCRLCDRLLEMAETIENKKGVDLVKKEV